MWRTLWLLLPALTAMPLPETTHDNRTQYGECVAETLHQLARERDWESAILVAGAAGRAADGCGAVWQRPVRRLRYWWSFALPGRIVDVGALVVCGDTLDEATRTLRRMKWSSRDVLLLVEDELALDRGSEASENRSTHPAETSGVVAEERTTAGVPRGTLLFTPCSHACSCLWKLSPPRWLKVDPHEMRREMKWWTGRLHIAAACVPIVLAVSLLAHYICRQVLRCGVSVEVPEEDVSWSGATAASSAGAGVGGTLSCWLRRLHEFGAPVMASRDTEIKFKGVRVRAFTVPRGEIALQRKTRTILREMRTLNHDNVAPFLGVVCARGTLIWERGSRGSLQQVLRNDGVELDWSSRLSLLTDLVKGLRHVHGSSLRYHGRLTSRVCMVDARWLLQLADVGLAPFLAAHARHELDLTQDVVQDPRDLLWTAPELLREAEARGGTRGGTRGGDMFATAIIMQEVLLRGEPYCMLPLSPAELIRRLKKPPPLIRPRVPLSAAPPEAVRAMRRCWSERPSDRPDCGELLEVLMQLQTRKANMLDSMFEMMEKYSNNLEELVRERTQQLVAEKRRTELLLHRMLPRSVAQSLVQGRPVPAQQVADASVLFLDVVGFTRLAARMRPVQVAALLDKLYSRFDAAVRRRRVYKVETVGDAYMLAAGLPEPDERHAASLARAGVALLRQAARARLAVRAGMHCGPVCAAVVGLTLPRYCLFGDTVNTAARMEATGRPRRLQLSAKAARRLRDDGGFRTLYRGKTYVKGKGRMHTYWLLGKKRPDERDEREEAIHEDEDDADEEEEEEEEDESPELDYGEETSESESEACGGPPSPWFPPASAPEPGRVYREGPQRQFSFDDADDRY